MWLLLTIKNALHSYDQDRGVLGRLVDALLGDHPAIQQLRRMSDANVSDDTDYQIMVCQWFINEPPDITIPAYAAYESILITIINQATNTKANQTDATSMMFALAELNKNNLLMDPYFSSVLQHRNPLALAQAYGSLCQGVLENNEFNRRLITETMSNPNLAYKALHALSIENNFGDKKEILEEVIRHVNAIETGEAVLLIQRHYDEVKNLHLHVIKSHRKPIDVAEAIIYIEETFPTAVDDKDILAITRHANPKEAAKAFMTLDPKKNVDSGFINYFFSIHAYPKEAAIIFVILEQYNLLKDHEDEINQLAIDGHHKVIKDIAQITAELDQQGALESETTAKVFELQAGSLSLIVSIVNLTKPFQLDIQHLLEIQSDQFEFIKNLLIYLKYSENKSQENINTIIYYHRPQDIYDLFKEMHQETHNPKPLYMALRQRTLDGLMLYLVEGRPPDHDNTHTASIHQTSSESATRLLAQYENKIDTDEKLDSIMQDINLFLDHPSLDDRVISNREYIAAAKRYMSLLNRQAFKEKHFSHRDPTSGVTLKQLLALTYIAFNDKEQLTAPLKNALENFIQALNEIIRAYNTNNDEGTDNGEADAVSCPGGAFNKLIEKGISIHPYFEQKCLTHNDANVKARQIICQELAEQLLSLAQNPESFDMLSDLAAFLSNTRSEDEASSDQAQDIWESVRETVTEAILEEFSDLYPNKEDGNFMVVLEFAKDHVTDIITLNDLKRAIVQSRSYQFVIYETIMEYFARLATPHTAGDFLIFTNLICHVKKEGLHTVWEHLFNVICNHILPGLFTIDFYNGNTHSLMPDFDIKNLDHLQKSISMSTGYRKYCSHLLWRSLAITHKPDRILPTIPNRDETQRSSPSSALALYQTPLPTHN